MKSIAIGIACVVLAGCVSTYASMEELPAENLELMKRAESYYLQKAVDDAAFRFGCEREKTVATVVGSTKGRVCVNGTVGGWFNGERPSTIGVDACGQRVTYKIVCGYQEGYAEAAVEGSENVCGEKACQVVVEGSPAQSAINRANEESSDAAERNARMQQEQRSRH